MSIRRRTFLQASGGMVVASLLHSCAQPSTPVSKLTVSDRLLSRIQKRGYLLVATEDDYPPFEFLVNGQSIGYDNDLLAQLRTQVPFEIRQEILPWQEILPGVRDGKYDVALTAVGITDDRAQFLDFTVPISESTIAYVKRKGDPSIKSVTDLAGKAIGVQQGGVSLAAVPDLEATLKQQGKQLGAIKQYRSFPEAYQDLINHKIDAVLHTLVSLSVLVNDKPAIFERGDRVGRKSYAAWAVKKDDADLLGLLNQFLIQVRASPDFNALQKKWLKISFENLPRQPLLPGDRAIP